MQAIVIIFGALGETDRHVGPFPTVDDANTWGLKHSQKGFFVVEVHPPEPEAPEPPDEELLALTNSVASTIRDLVSAVIDYESESEGRWYKGVDDGIERISTLLAEAIQHKRSKP